MFAARTKSLNTLSFHHTSRPLADGESIPRMPSLLEQIEACRFVAEQPAEEDAGPPGGGRPGRRSGRRAGFPDSSRGFRSSGDSGYSGRPRRSAGRRLKAQARVPM